MPEENWTRTTIQFVEVGDADHLEESGSDGKENLESLDYIER